MAREVAARALVIAAVCVVAGACRMDLLIQPPLTTHDQFLTLDRYSLVDSAAVGSTVPRLDTIQIRNDGGGELQWTARVLHASPWLTLQPDTGTAGQSAPLQVRTDPTGLALGVYRDTVLVVATSKGSTLEVPVVFRIHP